MSNKKQKLSQENKAKIIAIARGISMASTDVLAITILGLVDKVLFAKSEAGESITEEEQVQVARDALRLIRDGMEDRQEVVGAKPVDAETAGEIATSAIARAIKAAKASKAKAVEGDPDFKLPPGSIVAPGNDSVN